MKTGFEPLQVPFDAVSVCPTTTLPVIVGGVTFAGGSVIAGPDGSVLAQAGDDAEETLLADLDLDAVTRARRPYAHIRVDDLRLVYAKLGAMIAAGA